ncbi:MAG: hypothetical protein Q4A82_06675 [Corynebacterium sp.]|nr:hypothetical protein [Corynebacterium sp.]
MNINELLSPDVAVPLLIGLAVLWVILKSVKRIINRVISLAATALILGATQHVGAFDGLNNLTHLLHQ